MQKTNTHMETWLWTVIALSIAINIGCEIYRANYDYKSYEDILCNINT